MKMSAAKSVRRAGHSPLWARRRSLGERGSGQLGDRVAAAESHVQLDEEEFAVAVDDIDVAGADDG